MKKLMKDSDVPAESNHQQVTAQTHEGREEHPTYLMINTTAQATSMQLLGVRHTKRDTEPRRMEPQLNFQCV
jgi:hypothetical protein